MATYAIGDVQGCFSELQQLLQTIAFDPTQDHLWFAGDLVNRGPDSLAVLRFVHQLGHRAITVLGNHDLHLLALYYTDTPAKRNDTLQDVLNAPDVSQLMDWLRHQPLVHVDSTRRWCMSHAGIPPHWSIRKTQRLAHEVETVLQGNDHIAFFQSMYGNQPNQWNKRLTGQDRYRVIVNYLTRMRFINAQQELDLVSKEGLDQAPAGYYPWFDDRGSQQRKTRLLFGHWAALEGHVSHDGIFALDTGCVWGGHLSALRLDDQQWFRVPASQPHSLLSPKGSSL